MTNTANKSISDMEAINPLITSDGSTYRVSAALTALADLVAGNQTMEPDSDQGLGLSLILTTCVAALRRMGEVKA